jgi:DUF917 family protein
MVRWIAAGAGILGTGGGGNPYYGQLHVLRLMSGGAQVRVVDPDELPDDALCVSVGGMGAPTIGIEKVRRGDEPLVALRALEAHTGRKAEYLISGEIGGSNALWPMAVAAQTGLPVIDGDGMGRAFPELQQNTFSIYGVRCTPAAIADVKHNVALFDSLADTVTLERYARAVTIQMGGSSGYAFPLMSGRQVKDVAVKRTITLSCQVGWAMSEARRNHADPVQAILACTGGEVVFRGKVVDVDRRLVAGFSRGRLKLDTLNPGLGTSLEIDLQNEYLIARRDGEVAAVVPDLICLADLATGQPVTTEIVRYGLRVAVLRVPAPELLTTPEALRIVGPAAFGYGDTGYRPGDGSYGAGRLTAAGGSWVPGP